MGNLKTLKPFQKGPDPRRNTKGRPKLEGSFTERLREKVNETKIMVNGEEVDFDMALIMQLISLARNGNHWATTFLFDRLYGKPKALCPGCRDRMAEESRSQEEKDLERKEARKNIEAMLDRYIPDRKKKK